MFPSLNKYFIKLPLALLGMFALEATAGGLWMNEQGTPAMGRAGAGAEAGTDDASASFHNPASMSRIDQSQVMAVGGLIYAETAFNLKNSGPINGTDDGGDAGGTTIVGGGFYVRPLNEDWRLGVSMAGITGAELDYNKGWAGRLHSEYVSIVGLSLMPSLSYQVNDSFSVGLGLPILYSELEMVIGGFNGGELKIDGDDTQVGVHLSTHYEFNEQTRVGLYYQSEFEMDYGGNGEISEDFDPLPGRSSSVNTEVTFAARVYAGLSHEFTDELSGHVTLGWEDWSAMDEINLTAAAGGGMELGREWEDTYHYAVGASYQLSKTWLLNAGFAYDTNPTDAKNRTADMPMDRQVRYSWGFEHERASGFTIAAQLVYADYGSAKIKTGSANNPPATGYSGDYADNDLWFFNVSANWLLGD